MSTDQLYNALHQRSQPDYRRPPLVTFLAVAEHGSELIAQPLGAQIIAALMAGSFITFGAALSVFLTQEVESLGVSNLLLGLGFSTGFFLVVTTGAALFTEVNVAIPVWMLTLRRSSCFLANENESGVLSSHSSVSSSVRTRVWQHCQKCLRFWVRVWVFNLLGALFVGAMMKGGNVMTDEANERLSEILISKIAKFKADGVTGWFEVVASAFLGNWLVGLAALLATSARTLPGKMVGVFFPVLCFVALGVQHTPANMGYFSIGLISINNLPITWEEAFIWNILPASIGNILGALVMVAGAFFYLYVQHDDELWEELSGRHLVIAPKKAATTDSTLHPTLHEGERNKEKPISP